LGWCGRGWAEIRREEKKREKRGKRRGRRSRRREAGPTNVLR
jgi:hypothetical protein